MFTYPPNSFNYQIPFAEKEKRKGSLYTYYYIIYNKSTEKNIQTVRILYNKIAENKEKEGYIQILIAEKEKRRVYTI